ncbi:MAG: hypothetical protein U0L61_00170 [Alistipes sp.]|nr:hypothetical protein [Alistipes sp.]
MCQSSVVITDYWRSPRDVVRVNLELAPFTLTTSRRTCGSDYYYHKDFGTTHFVRVEPI